MYFANGLHISKFCYCGYFQEMQFFHMTTTITENEKVYSSPQAIPVAKVT